MYNIFYAFQKSIEAVYELSLEKTELIIATETHTPHCHKPVCAFATDRLEFELLLAPHWQQDRRQEGNYHKKSNHCGLKPRNQP